MCTCLLFKLPTTLSIIILTSIVLMSHTTQADEITVGYFLEWPTPNQYAQIHKLYDKALEVDVNWVAFESGTAMSAAMASGDVQISFSQGIPPFVVAASAGQDIKIVDIAVSYADNENCVIKADLEIDKNSADELEGKHIAVPFGTAAHFSFLKQMEHLNVDTTTMRIVDMTPPDAAAAFANGNLDMVCGWGGALNRMKQYGNVLFTGREKEKIGIHVFDATTVNAQWAQENPELLSHFLKLTADMNARFLSPQGSDMLPDIAKAAGMSIEATSAALEKFVFPDIQTQLSYTWLGGNTQKFLKSVGDFFVSQGTIPKALDSYENTIDTSYLKAAADL